MKVEELTPKPIDKVQFKLASFKSVPHDNGCYILTTFENDILYIGLAVNLNNRFKQHLENPEKIIQLQKEKPFGFTIQLSTLKIYQNLNELG